MRFLGSLEFPCHRIGLPRRFMKELAADLGKCSESEADLVLAYALGDDF